MYAQVKAHGFSWAPKQEVFIAPMWTPSREDFLLSLVDAIEDEDSTTEERAAARAERFAGYQERRAEEAERAHSHVEQIAGGIPLGQPILIGHHSQRRAEKDAEKIRAGMNRAVNLWKTSEYWKQRAHASLAHAAYLERPDVRARRIKTLEADLRSRQRDIKTADDERAIWEKITDPETNLNKAGQPLTKDGQPLTFHDRAVIALGQMGSHDSTCFALKDFPREPPISQYEGAMGLYTALEYGIITADYAKDRLFKRWEARKAHAQRWIEHYENRIAYERAMLGESGGIPADKFNFQIGGRVLIRGEWMLILRLNKKAGKVVSVTTNCAFVAVRPVEEIQDYREPAPEEAAKVEKVMSKAPLCNYPHANFVTITKAQWDKLDSDYKGTTELGKGRREHRWTNLDNIETHAPHRVRYARARQVNAPSKGMFDIVGVYISDSKTTTPPELAPDAPAEREKITLPRLFEERPAPVPAFNLTPDNDDPRAKIEALEAALKSGVKAVSAPQLFPTPPVSAQRVIEEAKIEKGHLVLEPEAGTGSLVEQLYNTDGTECVAEKLTLVEINHGLAQHLERTYANAVVHCADFLTLTPADLGYFDRIIMNPPFANLQDVDHVTHAFTFLKPGGRLVAIMGEGAFFRQDRKAQEFRAFLDLHGISEQLPAGSFEASGTNVNTRIVILDKPGA
jgi:phospholipid N-methyltransferase